MTDCPNAELRDLLPDLLHDRLDGATRTRVEAHLRGCEECRGELALLRSLRAVAPTPRLDVAGIVAALPAPRAPRRWTANSWRIAAAIVVLAAGGSSLVAHFAGSRPTDSVRVAALSPAHDSAGDSGRGAAGDVELNVGYGYSDLTDAQLLALLKDVQQINAMPSAETDATVPNVTLSNGGA